MGHPYQSWWCGSDLDIEESRRLVPHQHATTMQVAISVVAGCMWMLENSRWGLCVPDDLPHDYVLNVSKPLLGQVHFHVLRLEPTEALLQCLHGYNQPQLDTSDPWQFKNFLITEGD
jgi:homospermidine synthase